MALICLTLASPSPSYSDSKLAPILSTSSSSNASPSPPSSFPRAFLVPPPLLAPLTATKTVNYNNIRRTKRHVVRMAPDEEKLTRRNPLEFPVEWDRPRPGRRPDIFPQFSPMKTPLPPPMPFDPPDEDEEEEEEEKKKEEEEGDEDGGGDDDAEKPEIGR